MKTTVKISIIFIILIGFFLSCAKKDATDGKEFAFKATRIVGKAELIRNNKSIPLKINMLLSKEDLLKTKKGTVDFKIIGLGIFKLKPYSQLLVASLTKSSELRLDKGKILAVLNKLKKNASFSLETPTAVVGIRGTSFVVSSSEKQVKVGVLTGKVAVNVGRKSIKVDELNEASAIGKELKQPSKMAVSTIVDVKEVLKIKEIENMEEYNQIKLNIKKLEIIEGNRQGLDSEGLSESLKARSLEEQGSSGTKKIGEKGTDLSTDKTIESKKKDMIKDSEF